MKRFVFVALMMVCSVSWAKWELCSISGEGDEEISFYCDKSTIRKNGVISRMWILIDFSSARTVSGDRHKSAKNYWAYNCGEETRAMISAIAYSEPMGEGNVVYSFTDQERDWKWTPVAPGTTGETIWKIACGKK
jgi:hypothetical protein